MRGAYIFYSGAVQGVGFRFTVQRYASRLDLKGWVRNLHDGRVEIFVDGSQEAIHELCEYIEKHFEGYIRNKEVKYQESQGEFQGFKIVY